MIRIGYGYDVHQLVENETLILGGVKIDYFKGLLGHSDADVLVHAIIDALLGSLALGDIGTLFPDTDNKYQNIDSRILLKKTIKIIHEKGFRISNLDCTICAQKPKLKPFILQMRKNIADDLQVEVDDVSIKATTEEKLGISGSEKGMSATAVVLVQK